jgi:hypothetical protein
MKDPSSGLLERHGIPGVFALVIIRRVSVLPVMGAVF